MKNIYLYLIALNCLIVKGQVNIEWQKCLGGSSYDQAYSIRQTKDGGYIVAGLSGSNDGDVWGNINGYSYWLTRLDAKGDTLWTKCLESYGNAKSVEETSDGGFIVVGEEYKVIRLDVKGDTLWTRLFGDSFLDKAYSVIQTNDQDYVIAGEIWGRGWCIIKLDMDGDTIWSKYFEEIVPGVAYSIEQTQDGGYIVAGSKDRNYTGEGSWTPNDDFFVVKLNANGDTTWTQSFGGNGTDEAYSVQQTSDGGYIVAGYSDFQDNDNYQVLKLNESGQIQWEKSMGGGSFQRAHSIIELTDGGYIIAGQAISGGEVQGENCGLFWLEDLWIVKLDEEGSIEWSECYGGNDQDFATSVQQTKDGGFVIAGYTKSNDGNVSGNHGGFDFWVLKLSSFTVDMAKIKEETSDLTIYPQQATDMLYFNGTENKNIELLIYSINGKLMKQTTGFDIRQTDISGFPEGLYIVHIVSENDIYRAKFVK